jgi:hypothetical protein
MFVRFKDLKADGIVDSRPQLKNLQETQGFPLGRLLSPQVRAWDYQEEIEPWLASRPVKADEAQLRGAAKILHEGGKVAPRRDRRAKNGSE